MVSHTNHFIKAFSPLRTNQLISFNFSSSGLDQAKPICCWKYILFLSGNSYFLSSSSSFWILLVTEEPMFCSRCFQTSQILPCAINMRPTAENRSTTQWKKDREVYWQTKPTYGYSLQTNSVILYRLLTAASFVKRHRVPFWWWRILFPFRAAGVS